MLCWIFKSPLILKASFNKSTGTHSSLHMDSKFSDSEHSILCVNFRPWMLRRYLLSSFHLTPLEWFWKKNALLQLDYTDVQTYLGSPPKSHSAQMYGPGLNITNKSSSWAICKNLAKSKNIEKSRLPWPKSYTPSSGSCKFQGTYL